MDEKKEILLEEFRALRAEMLAAITERGWGTLTYVLIAGGLAALYAQTKSSAVNLLLVYFAIPLLLHTASRERARIRIGAYVKTIIEPQLIGEGWETYLAEWRSVAPGSGVFSQRLDRWRHMFSLTGIYDISVVFSAIFVFVETESMMVRVAEGSGLILFVLCHVYLNGIYKHGENYETIFANIKEKFAANRRSGA